MKPQLLKVSCGVLNSFSARVDKMPDINNVWHYHQEIELVYFKKGSGTQFIGDHVGRFKEGDMILVGENLPHFWRFDDEYFKSLPDSNVEVYVVHFNEHLWGRDFLEIAEAIGVKQFFDLAKRGIQVPFPLQEPIGKKVQGLLHSKGFQKIIDLLDILNTISTLPIMNPIASMNFLPHSSEALDVRINQIYTYTIENFEKKISLEEISEVANLSYTSFCRYFRSLTGKSYFEYLNEVRISHACKLLIYNEAPIKRVCYESGYNNLSNFYRAFRKITGMTPLTYQERYLNKPGTY